MASAKDYAVRARRVTKTFGQGTNAIHALREIDFDAKLGELLMIVGPSGSGKTTLLSVVAGTLRIDSGEIDVLGNSLSDMTPAGVTEFRKKHIGFIFQQYHLVKTLSCWENVSIPLLLNGYSREQAEEPSRNALVSVGLKGREEDSPLNLSGGQQQRVAIARALIHNPDLIICDEPTAALDAENGVKIMELMKNIVDTPGRTVIVVTHDSRIFKFADRVVEMNDGRVEAVLNGNMK